MYKTIPSILKVDILLLHCVRVATIFLYVIYLQKYTEERIQCVTSAGYPRHRENRENRRQKKVKGQKKVPQGKHREFGNFAKTQGIWFAQVINSLILKVRDVSLFATKISNISIIFFGGAG